ncbi:MAG: hypothetical protein ACI4EF_01155 [Coprococcus sp.]
MPSINRIRVNNVKYNFGTQQYEDFTMRMYGRNTLYDLANGGGKSILMLLLLQNLIPNCTLDEKQPIEKLFRTGGGNTTIHSLIEWKLDEADIHDGYRYMTTGFCARKAKDAADDTDGQKDTAAIEYFNYCIFYREYNRNDIVNLPLSKGNEKITFSGLKTYLKELAHKDMGLEVKVFERKGEYQRFISQYGLHESHWEIIRGINKTEGHVRTYFETNYKTTRKVVEDLLIEEIIEKAFMTKTGRNGEDDTMAETLLDIKDKLNVLTQKKRDIANYDHQIELINVLEGKVNSCIGLYEEYDRIATGLADVYVTGKTYQEQGNRQLEELTADKARKYENKEKQKLRLENLKIARDNYRLQELNKAIEETNHRIEENEQKLKELEYQIKYKESINDYLGYLADRKQNEENKLIVEGIINNIDAGSEKMAVYAVTRKKRDEAKLSELMDAKTKTEKEHDHAYIELEYCRKMLKEAEIAKAVAENGIEAGNTQIAELNDQISRLTAEVSLLVVGDAGDMCEASLKKKEAVSKEISVLENALAELREKLYEDKYSLTVCETDYENMQKQLEIYQLQAEEYRQAKDQLTNIMTVYGVKTPYEAVDAINGRITGTISETIKRKQQIEKLSVQLKGLKEGKVFQATEGVKTVIDYISTRHGHMAVHGADYIAALPTDVRENILEANPALPYGVVTKGYEDIADDINIGSIDTGNECVLVYDMDKLNVAAALPSENVVIVGRSKDYFTSDDTLKMLINEAEMQINTLNEEINLINEKLATYQEDLKFVNHLADERFIDAANKEKVYNQTLMAKKDERDELKRQTAENELKINKMEEELSGLKATLEEVVKDTYTLQHIDELVMALRKTEDELYSNNETLKRTTDKMSELKSEEVKWSVTVGETTAKLEGIARAIDDIRCKWTEYFEPYMPDDEEVIKKTEPLDVDDEQLENEFMALVALARKQAPDLEDKKKLMEALSQSMSRMLKTIEKRGIDVETLKQEKELYPVSDEDLNNLDEELSRLNLVSASLGQQLKNDTKAYSRLEGSIEYAIAGINKTYGEGSYKQENITLAEAENAIKNGDDILKELELEYRQAVEKYDAYYKEQGFMTDLYKDVKRIVDTNDIDVSHGKVLSDNIDALRQVFENSLMKFDRSRKNLDKAKNELMRFKGQTAETLSSMGVFEMANTIRQDVIVPDTYDEAKLLLNNLLEIIEFIKLEKERVEKGIEDMVAIKDNFENQCIQRCMDVKTELEKLPKLSRITVGDDVIKMVDLTIPYVKEEFLKQRMSDYIDDIVKNADSYDDERKRIKYIRDCLGLKKLFGVMVTDMNAIKLKLYKRERIREQSRYLKYEEAVGSTGQSQGIYIQFLVAIINYISGMYSCGPEDAVTTKTIFIDNPFGAAKDIYIWEPIFAMLSANHVQLIVPARGATPAITGRFDVNYILGQQMVGGKQQTVVVDYSSKTNQEELEYQELSYEQATFDFI